MDLNSLKSFAKDARKELLKTVSLKIELILKEESLERRESPKAIKYLENKIYSSGKKEVIEEISYIWFNRFTALQFMDINGFNEVKVIMPLEGENRPEILADAINGKFHKDFISANTQNRVISLLNGSTTSDDPEKESYRLLIVSVCNEFNKKMPFLFEKIADYTELLLPDDLLSKTSLFEKIREVLNKDNCQDVEVIGWLYQFYISDRKDYVFDELKKNIKISPENIPAATQLFTPSWIVKYIVENTLGRLWMLNNPHSSLINKMQYFIDNQESKSEFIKINSPEEIKICDPACGSGHLLTYAFDLLYLIYEEEGYDDISIPALILKNNLFGIEIDKRASELSSFALTMKSRKKQNKFFAKPIQPNICCLENIKFESNELEDYMDEMGRDLFNNSFSKTLKAFEDSNNFGSLIKPSLESVEEIKDKLLKRNISGNLFFNSINERVIKVLNQTDYLRQKYHVVIANPPYMGGRGMNNKLVNFLKENYKNYKSDLFSAFIFRGTNLALQKGEIGFITPFIWMFLSTYEKLRIHLLNNATITSLIQLEYNAFGPAMVPVCTFTLQNNQNKIFKGSYIKLSQFKGVDNQAPKTLEAIKNDKCKWFYRSSTDDLRKIKGFPIAFWVADEIRNIFNNGETMQEYATPRQGLATGDNDRFLRLWYEVNQNKIKFSAIDKDSSISYKWFPCNKGGEFRRWYGNNRYIVNWKNNGQDMKNFQGSVIRNEKYYFLEGITWSTLSSSSLAMRYSPPGFIFESKGGVCIINKNNYWEIALCLMNTKIVKSLLLILSPTLDFSQGPIGKIPVIETNKEEVKKIANRCVFLTKNDWDNYETSWDFKSTPFLSPNFFNTKIETTYKNIRKDWKKNVEEMIFLEEENNRIFISQYGLQDELSPDVPLHEITLNCNPAYRYGKKVDEKDKEIRICSDTIKEFISYSVGCMFGRFSIDKKGFVLVNKGENLEDFLKQVPNPSFTPDDDNIIPILDLDWFEDDITSRFKKFLRVTFGEADFEENLRFIETKIGKDIRKYFLNDFYREHIQTYKKRPIYWLFSSPKNSFNVLIYSHRYQKDTISIILDKYLQEFMLKLRAEKNTLERLEISSSSSSREKTIAIRKTQKIDSILRELQSWERDVIFPLATQRLEIDLDDGVKNNYSKFGIALKKISGLK